MAGLLGRIAAFGRRIPSMECALVALLVGLSVVGDTTGLDRTVRMTATGLIAGLYAPGVRGVPIPKDAVARAQAGKPLSGVQAQAVRNP